jgi:hypothetical protein
VYAVTNTSKSFKPGFAWVPLCVCAVVSVVCVLSVLCVCGLGWGPVIVAAAYVLLVFVSGCAERNRPGGSDHRQDEGLGGKKLKRRFCV